MKSNLRFENKFEYDMRIRVEILNSIVVNFNHTKYLYQIPTTNLNSHWGLTRYNFFYVLNIELDKLFNENSKNQKFSFFNLFKKLENNNCEFGIEKSLIDSYRIKLEEKLKPFQYVDDKGLKKSLITKYRNEIFSHTDGLFSIGPKNNDFFIKVDELIETGFYIINDLSKIVLNKQPYTFHNSIEINNFYVPSIIK